MKNIVLIGFMGSGKTSCGKALSAKLNCQFCDTDEMIEKEQNMTISDIFEKYGEQFFRSLETKLAKSLCGKNVGVLSVGGGLAVTPGNGDILKQIGTVVYLKASKECLVKRLENDTTRPLLKGGSLDEKISKLMQAREEAYVASSNVIIETDGLSVEEVANKIIQKVQ